jgi:signal peptidase I
MVPIRGVPGFAMVCKRWQIAGLPAALGSKPMSDDQSAHEHALADADGPPGWPGGGEPGGPEPGPELKGSPMAGTAAQDEAAGSVTDASGAKQRPAKARSFWRELPVLIVVALVVALVIKSFVVQAFYIPSSSMENTLDIGDKVLVNKLVYHFRSIEPGDVIVFNGSGSWDPVAPPTTGSNPAAWVYDATLGRLFHSVVELFGTAPGQQDYIKRVVGVAGDHVACCNARGQVTVNGAALQESSYLFPGNTPSTSPFSVTVPPGRLWVMGDHRAVSCDSRCHPGDPGGGTIPVNEVVGRAFMIVWPPSRWRILPIPSTFAQPGVDHAASAALRLAAPYLPLGAGLAAAVPLTWLQRRLRRR